MAFSFNDFIKSKSLQDAEKKKSEYDAGYKESEKASDLYKNYLTTLNRKPAEWSGGDYGSQVKDALNKILNRKEFNYDMNADKLYQKYKDQYMTQGKLAMNDAIGQASTLTGGYGNSYAQTVGQQAYDNYLQRLNDRVPELYQLALNKYQAEGQDLINKFDMAKAMYDNEYDKYRDSVDSWNSDIARAYSIYENERANEQSVYNADRDYAVNAYNNLYNQEYGAYSDAYNMALAKYKQNVAENQWQKEYALQKDSADQSAKIAALENSLKAKEDEEKDIQKRMKATPYTSAEALNKAVRAGGSSITLKIMALEAMWEAGNITEDQYKDLVYALKNPGK